ncbi:hypothetical protein BC2230_30320 [Burkholderia cepacia]
MHSDRPPRTAPASLESIALSSFAIGQLASTFDALVSNPDSLSAIPIAEMSRALRATRH